MSLTRAEIATTWTAAQHLLHDPWWLPSQPPPAHCPQCQPCCCTTGRLCAVARPPAPGYVPVSGEHDEPPADPSEADWIAECYPWAKP